MEKRRLDFGDTAKNMRTMPKNLKARDAELPSLQPLDARKVAELCVCQGWDFFSLLPPPNTEISCFAPPSVSF